MVRFQANEVLSSLRTLNEGRYPHAKELCVDYQFFKTILGAKFNENNTFVYFNSKKNDKFKQTWNGNMTFLLIKFKILKIS